MARSATLGSIFRVRRAGPAARVEIVDPGRPWPELGDRRNLPLELGAGDHPVDTAAADRATDLARLEAAASVVDVTVGQAAEAAGPDPVTIVTSDRDDFERLATRYGLRKAS